MSMEIVTTGLGAGSYPEPPPMQEYESPACDECGWDDNKLIETDGKMLCPGCRARYIFNNATQYDYDRYICNNLENKKSFYYLSFFQNLPEKIRREIFPDIEVVTVLERYFNHVLDESENTKKQMKRDFIEANLTDFADFMEERSLIHV